MNIVASKAKKYEQKQGFQKLRVFLSQLKKPLRKLNKDKYADLYEQQARSRSNLTRLQTLLLSDPTNEHYLTQEKESREHYIEILSSVMSLIKQQCKVEWIQYGDDCTRCFFVRAEGRKLATYIWMTME